MFYTKLRFSTSFLKITSAVLISIMLSSCGGGGGSSSTSSVSSGPPSKLFVADSWYFAIASLTNSNPSTSVIAPDRTIVGANTHISNNVGAITINAATDVMYVANGTSILVFNNASIANGNAGPARTITSSQFGNVSSLFLDTAHNVLYVGDDAKGVWVINNASAANGSIMPNRSITGDYTEGLGGYFQIDGMVVDTVKDTLYVSRTKFTSYSSQILVFNNASTVNGSSVTPARIITPDPSISGNYHSGNLFIDAAHDRLFAAEPGSYKVHVFDTASAANGIVSPNRSIYLPASPAKITVDTVNDRLYALNPGALYIIANASTADSITHTVTSITTILPPGNSILSAIAVLP